LENQRQPSMSDSKAQVVIGVLGLFIAVVGIALGIKAGMIPVMFGEKDRFSCELQPDTTQGGEVWTVMYTNEKGTKPWLKMVTTLGGNWTPAERCQEIARKMELYREDGLIDLTYRLDPATPQQYVICAKTKVSGDECPLLITLKPDADPYETLREMTAALTGGDGVYQSEGGGSTNVLTPASPRVPLRGFLAEEDR
jgi:hypothetical protein